MQSYEWVDATSVEQATTLLAEGDPNKLVIAKAGGMDLLDLMKEGIISPSRIVNLKSIKGLDEIRFSEADGLALGTLVTLTRMAHAPRGSLSVCGAGRSGQACRNAPGSKCCHDWREPAATPALLVLP